MDEADRESLRTAVREALRLIIDPEIGRNIVDLGLIYTIAVKDDGIAQITMTTTTRFCPASGYLEEAVRTCVGAVPGVSEAQVTLTYEPPWSPDMMKPL